MYSLVIVEDDNKTLEKLKKFIPFDELQLELAGYASNGMDGLKCIKTVNPDIVISDINMPYMSGVEMLRHLSNKNTKFILLTAYADFNYAKEAVSHGVVEYLLKPFLPDDILEALKKCIKMLDGEKKLVISEEKINDDNLIIHKLKKFTEENIKDVSFDKLASYLGFSERHLSRLFKNETGINYKQYLISVRMEKAKELLETKYYKIYEVVSMVGYKDIRTFRDAFKEHFGISPSDI